MDRFLALDVFTKVAELGSFARAAERLGISTSACSRHVADLEAHLDTRLLNRTTRRLSLTESGQAFLERAQQVLSDLEEAERAAASGRERPRGTLKLTCAINFGVRHVAPAIGEFMAQHPEVRFDVSLSDRMVDIVEEGFDLAIRIGESRSQNLIARKLGETRLVPCAAPSYIAKHGMPKRPADLSDHTCLTYEYLPARNVWRFRDRKGNDHPVRVSGPLHANNGELLAAVAMAGVGISMEPDFIIGPDIEAGRLVPLLRDFEAPVSSIYAVYSSRRHLSAKVRVFVDFLAERFARETPRGARSNRP
ncbi:MAG: LysR family transcriptional regulator [Burkholderiales bacterium]|jgi:DNA-binding transcriptional LysR family regulator|nr:LysR family transcriptional regulator [Burkholderiales bacterium]